MSKATLDRVLIRNKNSIFKNIKAHLKAKYKPEDPTENGGTKSRRILGRSG